MNNFFSWYNVMNIFTYFRGEVVIMLRKVIKKTIIVYSIIGLLIGLGMLIYSINNNDFTFHFGEKEVHGIVSGVIAVPFVPFIMAIVGFFHAIMFWFPLVYIYNKLTKRNQSTV
jgi:phosphotransferase system  glucose/maltose/N-acetylglucosamine-specific IIC component